MITVNGTSEEFSGTIAELLTARMGESSPRGIAVAVGRSVVPRADWGSHRVADGDAVEIVTAVQGG